MIMEPKGIIVKIDIASKKKEMIEYFKYKINEIEKEMNELHELMEPAVKDNISVTYSLHVMNNERLNSIEEIDKKIKYTDVTERYMLLWDKKVYYNSYINTINEMRGE